MSLKRPLLLFGVFVLLVLSRHFEWNIDMTSGGNSQRSVFSLLNALSSSKNPFLEDGRRDKRPLVTDRRLRDASLQREFNIDLVS